MQDASDQLLERIARRLKAMGHPLRLKILHALEPGELSVTDLLAKVGGSQANMSKHLNVLRAADLVTSRRDGLNVCYRVSDEGVFQICRTVCDGLLERVQSEADVIVQARAALLARYR